MFVEPNNITNKDLMKDIISTLLYYKENSPLPHHTKDYFRISSELRTSALRLLSKLLDLSKGGYDSSSLIVSGDYASLGYNNRSQFDRDRKELKDAKLLFYMLNEHVVNFRRIDYLSKRQFKELKKSYDIKDSSIPKFGRSIPPPPID